MELKRKHGAVDYDSGILSARCKVCGGRSTGVHYGVISCEGCKAFYKRGVINGIKYKCYFGSACPITAGTRGRRCKACRFRRCQEEGMDVRAMKGSRSWRAQDEKFEMSPTMVDNHNPQRDYVPDQEDAILGSPDSETYARGNHTSVFRLGSFSGSCVMPISRPKPESHDYTGVVAVRHQAENYPRVKVSTAPLTEHSKPDATAYSARHSSNSPDRGLSTDTGYANSVSALVPVNRPASFGLPDAKEDDRPGTTGNVFSSWMLSGVFPGVSSDFLETSDRTTIPKFLGNYVRAMLNRSYFLADTINQMQHAIENVIGKLANRFESFQSHPAFLQNNASPETERRVLRALQHDVGNNSQYFKLFLQSLPGFAEMDPHLLQKLIPRRYFHFWVFFHSSFYYDNADREVYFLADINLDQRAYHVDKVCEKQYADYLYQCVLDIRRLQLDDVMRYLLLVVSVLHPGNTRFPADDKAVLQPLHAHYLEALMHYVSGLTHGKQLVTALQQFFLTIPTMNDVSERYVTQLDFGSLPLRTAGGQTFRELFHSILWKKDHNGVVNRFHSEGRIH
ncbi:uncharacterized protein LOC129595311 isoform X2 [Paramacrobiotus metropolitanus]|uniref:uncharacterized protein LOC129595311 isoform X2 n=1 Tax=Paramacrobiotus metropolitanus TaxID=2943436 RepID=UPI002445DC40|nr:uncharacterized protein LOC129595311 isoform X2 [Paramacrobiotus metropolitanus]